MASKKKLIGILFPLINSAIDNTKTLENGVNDDTERTVSRVWKIIELLKRIDEKKENIDG